MTTTASDKNTEIELCSSGLLCSERWQFLTDVSGQPTGPIFRGQKSKSCKNTIILRVPAGSTGLAEYYRKSLHNSGSPKIRNNRTELFSSIIFISHHHARPNMTAVVSDLHMYGWEMFPPHPPSPFIPHISP
jgi:hypothetical protein